MFTIGIVDDEAHARAELVAHLRRLTAESGEQLSIREFATGRDLVAANRGDIDVLILDVEMPDMDGFETARRLRESDQQLPIIFATNAAQLAVYGYEVDALSYLVKPVGFYPLSRELQRALARLRSRAEADLTLTVGNRVFRLSYRDIVYAESERHRITIHTFETTVQFTGTLRALEEELPVSDFHRINSCFIVNMRHVRGVGPDGSDMATGESLRISRARRAGFLNALADYVGQR